MSDSGDTSGIASDLSCIAVDDLVKGWMRDSPEVLKSRMGVCSSFRLYPVLISALDINSAFSSCRLPMLSC